MSRWDFYKNNILKFIKKDSKILIISASILEIKIFKELGYSNFSITYYNENEKQKYVEFGFKENLNLFKADIKNLNFANGMFDYLITNATIHHVDLPHKAITEMYKVASKGILIVESNDSFFIKLATKFKFAEDFEISSIDIDKKSGGLLDTDIPNYVYRWTEREISKLIMSYDPSHVNHLTFTYSNDLSNYNFDKKNILKRTFFNICFILTKIFFLIFKKQQNCLGVFIDKTKIKKRFI